MSDKDTIGAGEVQADAPLLLELQQEKKKTPAKPPGLDAFAGVPPGDSHGRYMISIAAARKQNPAGVLIHDLYTVAEHPEICAAAATPRGDASRFNDLAWAIGRGYVQCPGCMPAPANEEHHGLGINDIRGKKPLTAAQMLAADPDPGRTQ